jgi:hypothetical protein
VTRPRLAILQRAAADVLGAARRRTRGRKRAVGPPPRPAADPTGEELARRLDATRERLRREIPPAEDRPG